MIPAQEVQYKMNLSGKEKSPFLFGIDFEMQKGFFIENPFEQSFILFDIRGKNNVESQTSEKSNICFSSYPEGFMSFSKKFEIIRKGLAYGDTFLINLTERTKIETNLSLEDIFFQSNAPYKICFSNKFVCFSPEIFIRINNGIISSFPMKGTIDADIADAEKLLINNYKEECEHYTIVDLIRNDLNRVAQNIHVERFRYIENIKTFKGNILQTSSEITGKLPTDYNSQLGDIIFKLLPAGSISGAPKSSTIRIIKEAEQIPRGYYTGVFGYFDGNSLDSAVMIRFIEKDGNSLFYRSGGGITINSKAEDEYKEMIAKIYLPI